MVGLVKLALEAGKATPAPPVGPALGAKGVNIAAFCKDYNARTADKAGYIIPAEITVYDVRSIQYQCYYVSYVMNSGIRKPVSVLFIMNKDFNYLQDRSFTFVLKTPPASVLLLKAAGTLSSIMCSLSFASYI